MDGKLFGSQTGYGYNGTDGTSHGMLRKSSTHTENGIPEIIVRCLKKINREKTTVGLYRTNGESKAIKNLRLLFVNYNQKLFNSKGYIEIRRNYAPKINFFVLF